MRTLTVFLLVTLGVAIGAQFLYVIGLLEIVSSMFYSQPLLLLFIISLVMFLIALGLNQDRPKVQRMPVTRPVSRQGSRWSKTKESQIRETERRQAERQVRDSYRKDSQNYYFEEPDTPYANLKRNPAFVGANRLDEFGDIQNDIQSRLNSSKSKSDLRVRDYNPTPQTQDREPSRPKNSAIFYTPYPKPTTPSESSSGLQVGIGNRGIPKLSDRARLFELEYQLRKSDRDKREEQRRKIQQRREQEELESRMRRLERDFQNDKRLHDEQEARRINESKRSVYETPKGKRSNSISVRQHQNLISQRPKSAHKLDKLMIPYGKRFQNGHFLLTQDEHANMIEKTSKQAVHQLYNSREYADHVKQFEITNAEEQKIIELRENRVRRINEAFVADMNEFADELIEGDSE